MKGRNLICLITQPFFNENDSHARIYVLVSVYSEKISLRQALSRLATLHASSIYQFLAVLHIVPSSCGQINGEQTFDQNSVKIGNLAVFPEILRSTPPRPALKLLLHICMPTYSNHYLQDR